MRNGSLALADYPGDVVPIDASFAAELDAIGSTASWGALRRGRGAARRLMSLATCEQRDLGPCGARFTDLAPG